MDQTSLKIAAWNLNHRARPRRIAPKVIEVIRALEADVLVLSEFVESDTQKAFIQDLAECGLGHVSLSGRLDGHNQVLVASTLTHDPGTLKMTGDETHAVANFLSVSLPQLQLELVGLRVPIFKLASENREYWEKFVGLLKPRSQERLVVIGDMNANANHDASRGGRHLRELEANGWRLAKPDGDWSYISASGTVRAPIDHVMAGRPVEIHTARYLHHIAGITVAGPSKVEPLSDHAILVAEIGCRPPMEVIVNVAAEGGAITLLGRRQGATWSFIRSSVDQTPELLDEPWIEAETGMTHSWEAALRLLDEYPWTQFAPTKVHPEFREEVLKAVRERAAAGSRYLSRWEMLCRE